MAQMVLSFEVLAALIAFAFATSITPGPNNLMLVASSANFGLRRTVPHALGISVGFAAMVVGLGLGLAELIDRIPWVMQALRVVCGAYVLYLAWTIVRAGAMGQARTRGRPLRSYEAAAFQWVNPKAVAMALGALALYAPGGTVGEVIAVATVFALVNFPSIATWMFVGTRLKRILTKPWRLRAFNITMAVLLVASVGWALAFASS